MSGSQSYTHKDFDVFLGEYHIMKQKLDSKIQALLIISKELEHCRNERDHYKAMIEHIKPEQTMQKTDKGKDWKLSHLFPDSRSLKGQSDHFLVQQLCEVKERDRALLGEVHELKQKLSDANGDIKLLRGQIAKQTIEGADDAVQSRHSSCWERKTLVDQLESLKVKYILLEKDIQTILDEKEELITERDAYKQKVCRLNHELNIALKGDEKRIIDVDAILMENRYLQERLKQTQEEKSLYLQTLSKYKNMLEKRRNKSAFKIGGPGSSNVIITHKQVEQMLQNTNLSQLPATQATVADLRSLALALFDSLNDKNIALSHQKKANKILGHRLSMLEKQISFLELSSQEETNDIQMQRDGSVHPSLDDVELPQSLNTGDCREPSLCTAINENITRNDDECCTHQEVLAQPWEPEGNPNNLHFADTNDQQKPAIVFKAQLFGDVQESSGCNKSPSLRTRRSSGSSGMPHLADVENADMTPELHRLVQDALEDLNNLDRQNSVSVT